MLPERAPEKRYLVLGEREGCPFGNGAFGEVFFAWDKRTNANVAVKKQNASCDTLAREFTAYAALTQYPHRNILRMLDSFVVDGNSKMLYLIFEMGDTNLWDFCKSYNAKNARLESDHAASLLGGVVCGLGHLHDLDLIHGDLTLKNILIGRDGRAIIADMGNLHRSDEQFSVWNRSTFYIRSPEYWMQPTASQPHIDIWALGVVAMKLLSGRLLFVSGNEISDDALQRNLPKRMFELLGSIDEASELRRLPGWSSFADTYAERMEALSPTTMNTVIARLVAMAGNRSRTDPCWSIVTSCILWVVVVEVTLRRTTNQ